MSGLLHPIPFLEPFEKWEIELMGPLSVTKREYWFIVVPVDYFIKFVKVSVLKSLMKQKVTRYLYEWIFTWFGTPIEIIFDNGPKFFNEVVENLLACLIVKHRFTTMYKFNTNGFVKRTNKTLCSMLAKKMRFMWIFVIRILRSTMLCGFTTPHIKLPHGIHLFI